MGISMFWGQNGPELKPTTFTQNAYRILRGRQQVNFRRDLVM